VNPNVAKGVDHHGQERTVVKLGDIVYKATKTSLILNHLESRGRFCVGDRQGVRGLCVGRSDCEITSDCEIGGREVSEVVIPGRRREVS
jgi:hypothetical protein